MCPGTTKDATLLWQDASRPQAFSPTPLKNPGTLLGTLPLLCCIYPSRYNIHQHRRYSSGPAFCCLKPSRCYSHASQWGPTVCVWMPDAITAHGSRKQCASEHKQIGAACSSQTLQSWDTADEQIARLNHFCLSCVQSSPYLFASHTNFTVKSVTCQIVPSTCVHAQTLWMLRFTILCSRRTRSEMAQLTIDITGGIGVRREPTICVTSGGRFRSI